MGGVVMLIAVVLTVLFMADIHARSDRAGGRHHPHRCSSDLIDDSSKAGKERSLGSHSESRSSSASSPSQRFSACSRLIVSASHPRSRSRSLARIDLRLPYLRICRSSAASTFPGSTSFSVNILLVGLCNAVNLTDGLDGLAAGTVLDRYGGHGRYRVSLRPAWSLPFLLRPSLAHALAFSGSTRYPADIFMGDTGSLALGMALGCLAVLTKSEFIVTCHRRPVRRRGALGHDPGVLLQENEEARVPHGAASSSFREEGLERDEGRYSFLDRLGHAFAAVGFSIYFANSMINAI